MTEDAAEPALPDYSGACVSNIVPALLDHPAAGGDWLPTAATSAKQVVLLVLDGLGWHQLVDRVAITPTLSAMDGGPIRTVVPSTTSTALTSIVTGTTPGEHGIVGYRMSIDHEVLNVLRWRTPKGDARQSMDPAEFQVVPPFLGERRPVVHRAEFATSGFTTAHLAGADFVGYRVTSTLVHEVATAVRGGHDFVYAYYDGVDKISHEYGLADHFAAEVAFVDRLVSDLIAAIPSGVALVVTADHGQCHVGDRLVEPPEAVLDQVGYQSGEARFRWLHARPGRTAALRDAASELEAYGWVLTAEEVVDEGWFGPSVSAAARGRLGDVALVSKAADSFVDPADGGSIRLIGRHGSVTEAEMDVPLLVAVA